MITLLSFMDKIYSDTKTLSMIYIIGSILLFIFIILLIFSLRKPDKKSTKIIEEPNIDKKEEAVEKEKEEIKEQKEEIQAEPENNKLESILNISEKQEIKEEKIEQKEEKIENISAEIPSIDDYVDNIVNKTYEKNDQFSSVYVDTSTIKLEKVLDKLNVDDDIKEAIVPEDEKTQNKEEIKKVPSDYKLDALKGSLEAKKDNINKLEELKKSLEEKKVNNNLDKLENLKKSQEEKKKSVNNKHDDLKSKLDAIKKNNNTNKLDDLKNKLDNLKNQ